MSKKKNYVFHSDAGHGWLAVKLKELIDLRIADKISRYSYVKGGTVYLEEDLDYSLFLEAKKNRGEYEEISIRESFRENSPIRGYAPFVF